MILVTDLDDLRYLIPLAFCAVFCVNARCIFSCLLYSFCKIEFSVNESKVFD